MGRFLNGGRFEELGLFQKAFVDPTDGAILEGCFNPAFFLEVDRVFRSPQFLRNNRGAEVMVLPDIDVASLHDALFGMGDN